MWKLKVYKWTYLQNRNRLTDIENKLTKLPRGKRGQGLNLGLIYTYYCIFSGGSDGKASACSAGTGVLSLGQEDPLEKGIATHYSILACRILWTEEPGGLQSMGSQRVRHDWVTNMHTQTHTWNGYNKDLLYSPRNFIQYSIMTYNGKDLKKNRHINICVTESPCCTPETL